MPDLSLAALFIQNKGEPIDFDGSPIHMSYRFQVVHGQTIDIELRSSNSTLRQGFRMNLANKKSYFVVNEQQIHSLVIWFDTAPPSFSVVCFPYKGEDTISMWNVWQHHSQRESDCNAWVGNAGMRVEEQPDHTLVFSCSDGAGEIDFDNFVFVIWR
ncbi:hypothetical protein JJB07_09750 [Tumebacillus sp. ITR2]|uniref:Uncharacterized protein n=1 Tax=Tumebacillus amylolyticus TaxID=2801339 RepID=A0ABS1J9J6_9BACL|nr:hypothetical protein [Tumebacillus amylolyticus]MBL0386937.1 hypothetical protein [Tumebacillus amylolyticus]